MAIVRKVSISGTERTDDSTILEVALIDFNESDPPASLQVGQTMTVEVEDDLAYDQGTMDAWFEEILETVHELMLKTIVTSDLQAVAERSMARG